MANLNLRKNLTGALSFTQLDENFEYLENLKNSLELSLNTRSSAIEGDLSTELVDRASADTSLESNITSIDTVLGTIDTTYVDTTELSEAVSVEKLRAETAEGVIEDNLSTELVDRASADTVLQGNIDGVANDLSAYETANDAALSTELVDRAAADTLLQNNIDGVASDLSQEILDRAADVDASVSVEKLRAETAEGVLQSNIDAEESRAISAEGSLNTKIDDLDNTYATDVEVSEAVSVEKLRAETAEGVIEGNLSTELVTRASADTVLQGNIDDVAGDLSAYQTDNDAALSTELVDRASADTVLQGNIDDVAGDLATEVTRATAAEGVIESNLSSELVTRASADTVLQGNIDDEESRAIAAEGVIEGNLSTELVARASADTSLESNITSIDTVLGTIDTTYVDTTELSEAVSVEKLRAETAEGVIEDNLSTELVDRASADTVLQGNIDDEESRAIAAEGVIEGNLSTELVTRASADTVLQGNIDAEESRAISAEGSLNTRIDDLDDTYATDVEVSEAVSVEKLRAETAEGVIEGNLSSELVARASADTVLQGNIDAEEIRAISVEGSLETVAENPKFIKDGNRANITSASGSFINAPAIVLINAPTETIVDIDMTSAVAGTISTFIVKDLDGASDGLSEVAINFNNLKGNPYGTGSLTLQEGESAQIYMDAVGEGILLALNKAVSYVTEYPSDLK